MSTHKLTPADSQISLSDIFAGSSGPFSESGVRLTEIKAFIFNRMPFELMGYWVLRKL